MPSRLLRGGFLLAKRGARISDASSPTINTSTRGIALATARASTETEVLLTTPQTEELNKNAESASSLSGYPALSAFLFMEKLFGLVFRFTGKVYTELAEGAGINLRKNYRRVNLAVLELVN